jgi:monoamine oxidase
VIGGTTASLRCEDGRVDVCVVGAGVAGLVAARELERAGLEVCVLEARDRVGGRLLNAELPGVDGAVVEVGGQWVGPTQDRVLALLREVGLETFPTHATGEHLMRWRGRLVRYRGTIPRLSPLVLADVAQAQARLERLARRVDPDAPWAAPDAERLDAQTFATWIGRAARTAGGRTLLEIACEAVWACEPADVSLLHVLAYTNAAGGFDALIGTEGGAQQDRVVGGTALLPARLAEGLRGGVRLRSPVRSIVQRDGAVEVESDGGVVVAGAAVVAIPPALAARIAYAPAVPAGRDQLLQRLPQGSVAKCMAVYDRPFWRAEGLSGQALSDEGPTRIMFDNSPPGGEKGVLLGFLEGRTARELGAWSPEARRDAVVAGFARVFGPRAAAPEAYVERLWADEAWSRGCYGAYLPPGAWTAHGWELRRPHGRVLWAGAETATVWMGYIDGAVRSGARAAREALALLA